MLPWIKIYPFPKIPQGLTTLLGSDGKLYFRTNDTSEMFYKKQSYFSGANAKDFIRVRDIPGMPDCCFTNRVRTYRVISSSQLMKLFWLCKKRSEFLEDWTSLDLVKAFEHFWLDGKVAFKTLKSRCNGINSMLAVHAVQSDGIPMRDWYEVYRKKCLDFYAKMRAYQATLQTARPVNESMNGSQDESLMNGSQDESLMNGSQDESLLNGSQDESLLNGSQDCQAKDKSVLNGSQDCQVNGSQDESVLNGSQDCQANGSQDESVLNGCQVCGSQDESVLNGCQVCGSQDCQEISTSSPDWYDVVRMRNYEKNQWEYYIRNYSHELIDVFENHDIFLRIVTQV